MAVEGEGEGEEQQLLVTELVVDKVKAQEGMSEALVWVWVWVREAMAMVYLGDIFMSLGGQLALS